MKTIGFESLSAGGEFDQGSRDHHNSFGGSGKNICKSYEPILYEGRNILALTHYAYKFLDN